jgi:hypothetical protein
MFGVISSLFEQAVSAAAAIRIDVINFFIALHFL